mgnify:CR=1 FL=1
MMKNILLSLFLACGLIMACSDDETPSPSYEERDWWVLTYDPNADELDQLIYKIYDETGLRFFYNDTLGTETRYTYGEPYTHYQTYMMGYDFIHQNRVHRAFGFRRWILCPRGYRGIAPLSRDLEIH